jgi:hypothetical protein
MSIFSYKIILASPKKTESGFHFVSSTLCDLVHIPDMLQTACVSECAVSIFMVRAPKGNRLILPCTNSWAVVDGINC